MSTVKELKSLAKERGIRGYSSMRKSELLESLGQDKTPDPTEALTSLMGGLSVSKPKTPMKPMKKVKTPAVKTPAVKTPAVKTPAVKTPEVSSRANVRLPELRNMAKQLGIPGYTKMRRPELEEALMKAEIQMKRKERKTKKLLRGLSPERKAPEERSEDSITDEDSDEGITEFAFRLEDMPYRELVDKVGKELYRKTIGEIKAKISRFIKNKNKNRDLMYGDPSDLLEFMATRFYPAQDKVFRRLVKDYLRTLGTFWFNITWKQFAEDLFKFFRRNIKKIEIPELVDVRTTVIKDPKRKKVKRKRLE